MIGYAELDIPDVADTDELAPFCAEIFSAMPRSDQRRWAEVYTRGLLSVPGRKSVRRISDQVVGRRVDQCLQQFLNQSPWKWEPLRRSLAQQLSSAISPRIWAVQQVVFPKNGDASVGVAKQYSAPAQRTLNCQLGLAVLLADEDASCAVNWRLELPRCWDDDEIRRRRVHLPSGERHQPTWRYVLDAVDELLAWGLPSAPVVLDANLDQEVEPLLQGLENRGLRYILKVREHTPALPAGAPPSHRGIPAGLPTPRRNADLRSAPTVGELAAYSAKMGRMTLTWRAGIAGATTTSRFSTVTVPGGGQAGVPVRIGPGHPYRPPRSVLAEWPTGRGRPAAMWLTNLNTTRLPELISLVKLRGRVDGELAALDEQFGLRSFEGRSFRGWHHHVTLVSAAHVYQTLRRLDAERDAEPVQLRPRA